MAGLLGRLTEHERVEALLSSYLDGRTSEAERALVEQHLKSCADCGRDLATLRTTVAAVREMPHIPAPRSFALPRSMAQQPRAVPRTYPLLRGATAIATLLFAVVLGVDLIAHGGRLPAAAPQMAAPAALPSTSIAMEGAATPAPASTPPRAAFVAPAPTGAAKQAAPTPAPPSAPQALSAAPALLTTPADAARAAQTTAPVEPPVEQPLPGVGLGGGGGVGGMGGGAQAPGGTVIPPAPAPATAAGEAATVHPTLTPAPAPTQIARALEPQPPSAPPRGAAYQVERPGITPLRVVEVAFAALAVVLGVAAWAARRRSR